MNLKVYTAGPMTGLPLEAQVNWRTQIENYFGYGEVLSPTRPTVLSTDEIGCFNRDLWDIQNSTCLLFNLLQPVEQISLGTISEMTVGHMLNKPMIFMIDPATSHKLYVNHPFMKGFKALWVTNLTDAISLIDEIHGR